METSVPVAVPVKLNKLGKARSVCFTLNNYTLKQVELLRTYAKDCKYIVFGYETAPETGTPHLQGLICWENPRSLDLLQQKVSKSLHLEKMVGTHKQASDYCKFEDYPACKVPNKFEEFGELPSQGHRIDWSVALTSIKEGADINDVIDDQPHMLPCIRALENYRARSLKPKHREVNVIVLWGDSGSGKSRWAYEKYPDIYSKPPNKWWDGYHGQTTILLDDFYGYIPYSELLNILDRYPYNAEVKGAHVWAQWDTVIITSNKPPQEWYKFGLTPALKRRLNTIYFYSIDGLPQIYETPSPIKATIKSPQQETCDIYTA